MQIRIAEKKRIGIYLPSGISRLAERHQFYVEGDDILVVTGFKIENNNTLIIN